MLEALSNGPVWVTCGAFVLATNLAYLLTDVGRGRVRWCCRAPSRAWQWRLDHLLGQLLWARFTAWAYLGIGDVGRAASGDLRGAMLAGDVLMLVLLLLEARHRSTHRRERHPARARGRVVNLGHRLAVVNR